MHYEVKRMKGNVSFGSAQVEIKATIKPKDITFYLTTDDNLKSIKSSGITADIFALLSSLLWGAFFTFQLGLLNNQELQSEIVNILKIYKNVFLIGAMIFTSITIYFFICSWNKIKDIKMNTIDDIASN